VLRHRIGSEAAVGEESSDGGGAWGRAVRGEGGLVQVAAVVARSRLEFRVSSSNKLRRQLRFKVGGPTVAGGVAVVPPRK
jgi:hypothetical protein